MCEDVCAEASFQESVEQLPVIEQNLSKKISGVPKTTIIDICSGKSSIGNCSAKNVYAIATAMDCTVEFLLNMSADT